MRRAAGVGGKAGSESQGRGSELSLGLWPFHQSKKKTGADELADMSGGAGAQGGDGHLKLVEERWAALLQRREGQRAEVPVTTLALMNSSDRGDPAPGVRLGQGAGMPWASVRGSPPPPTQVPVSFTWKRRGDGLRDGGLVRDPS